MLFGKHRSIPGRVARVLFYTAVIAAAGTGVPWAGAEVGLWGWPRASSWYGVLLGLTGGLIVLFEMALLPRKWFRGRRLGATRVWMQLHIWLGLICLPVILVHTGFDFGGPLTATTLVLFLLVTASGVWGLVLQQWLPQKILAEVPGETVASQIDFVGDYHAREAARLIDGLVSAPPDADQLVSAAPAERTGAAILVRRAEPLLTGPAAGDLLAFQEELLDYLREGHRAGTKLFARTEVERRFAQLREEVPADAVPILDQLEQLCDLRRQWDVQARLNFWLHNWLVLHLPLSVAMTGLMLLHAVRALKYW
ncbi:MAG: hypothetical protein JWO38_6184 [Gemmataceae bacterium]|nr:hypothetical protein [Gemmataceae bacterium]